MHSFPEIQQTDIRAMTEDETKRKFVREFFGIANYHADRRHNWSTTDRCHGVAQHILWWLSGYDEIPSVSIYTTPVLGEIEECARKGQNYTPTGVLLNDVNLRELYPSVRRKKVR